MNGKTYINTKNKQINIKNKQVNIIDKYVKEFGFLPPIEEYVKFGGNIKWVVSRYGSYSSFYKDIGYDGYVCRYGYAKRYKVVDVNGDTTVFIGTLKEIYNKYFKGNYDEKYIRQCVSKHTVIMNRYRVCFMHEISDFLNKRFNVTMCEDYRKVKFDSKKGKAYGKERYKSSS